MVTSLRMIFLLLYLVIVSQGIFYLFAVSKAYSNISMPTYAEQRNAIDLVITPRLKVVYLTSLLIGIAIIILTYKNPRCWAFISTNIAFVCLIIEISLAVKYNMPINVKFNAYAVSNHTQDWKALRHTWLQMIEYRGVLQVIGFLGLLFGIGYRE